MDRDHTISARFGTPGQVLWAKQLGSVGTETATGITIDSEQNLVTAGSFNQTLTIAPGTVLTSAGLSDVYVVKLASSTGSAIWAKRLGGTGSERVYGIALDGGNNTYVVGDFRGTVDFGDGPRTAAGTSSNVFVLKLDANGTFQWVRTFNIPSVGANLKLAVGGNAVAITGVYVDSISIETTTLTSAGSSDFFVLKMSAATGSSNWVRSFGGPLVDTSDGVAVDRSGSVVLTGSFSGSVSFGANTLSSDTGDGFLLKLSGEGAHLLSRQLGVKSTGANIGSAIAVDSLNNILVAGRSAAPGDFGCPTVPASPSIFIAKYTSTGACTWAKGLAGTGSGEGLAANDVGDVAFTGTFCGPISVDGRTLTAANACGPNVNDMIAARFTADGLYLNAVRGGGGGSEAAAGIAHGFDGQFFVAGSFQGATEFGNNTLTSVGDFDAYIVGYAPL